MLCRLVLYDAVMISFYYVDFLGREQGVLELCLGSAATGSPLLNAIGRLGWGEWGCPALAMGWVCSVEVLVSVLLSSC
jgi:hypothetical protein